MATIHPFLVGHEYKRQDVFDIIGIQDPGGGNWYTGYNEHNDDWFIFCNIGTPGRTGHDYDNHFLGEELVWYGKTKSHLEQPSIQSLLTPGRHVYVFYRDHDKDPFTFAGVAIPVRTRDVSPVEIVWAFADAAGSRLGQLAEEVAEPAKVFEGAKKSITVTVYERDPNARRKCIKHWGLACVVCGFEFKERYGSLGEGFIHVHHLRPLGDIGEEYVLDPVNDLRPVCPNCHAMLHRNSPVLSIEALRERIHEPESP